MYAFTGIINYWLLYFIYLYIVIFFSSEFLGYMHRAIFFEKDICNLFLTLTLS